MKAHIPVYFLVMPERYSNTTVAGGTGAKTGREILVWDVEAQSPIPFVTTDYNVALARKQLMLDRYPGAEYEVLSALVEVEKVSIVRETFPGGATNTTNESSIVPDH